MQRMSEHLVPTVITAILIALNGLFAAAEFAIAGAARARFAERASEGHRTARVIHGIPTDARNQDRRVGHVLEHEDVETVSGLVLALLDRPPVVGDVVEYRMVRFIVTEVEGHGVARCAIEEARRRPDQATGSATRRWSMASVSHSLVMRAAVSFEPRTIASKHPPSTP